MNLEAMIPVIKGEIPLKAHAHRADDILTSIRIAKEFGVGLTLDHCTDGALIADELAKEGYQHLWARVLTPRAKLNFPTRVSLLLPYCIKQAFPSVLLPTHL